MSETEVAPAMVESELLVHKTLAYSVTRLAVWTWLKLVHRLRVEGRENLPLEGPVVIASNHQSFLDIPIVAASTRRHVCFVARDSLARSRPLAWLMRRCGAVLIGRGTADRRALREMGAHLAAGDCLTVFPEGTRSEDGRLGPFKGGAIASARRAGAVVVPTAIRGAIDALPRGASFPRPARITITFGVPLDPAEEGAEERLLAAVEALVGDGRT